MCDEDWRKYLNTDLNIRHETKFCDCGEIITPAAKMCLPCQEQLDHALTWNYIDDCLS